MDTFLLLSMTHKTKRAYKKTLITCHQIGGKTTTTTTTARYRVEDRPRECLREITNKFKSSVKRTPYDRLVDPGEHIGFFFPRFSIRWDWLLPKRILVNNESDCNSRNLSPIFHFDSRSPSSSAQSSFSPSSDQRWLLLAIVVAVFALFFPHSGRVKIYALWADRF